MRKLFVLSTLAALLCAALIAPPLVAVQPAAPAGAETATPAFARLLPSWLVGLLEVFTGPEGDTHPDGPCTDFSDQAGPMSDPDGLTASGQAGPASDPNGGEVTGQAGPDSDPDGIDLSAQAGPVGDPNG